MYGERYISVGDIAHVGAHFPSVAAVYQNMQGRFALPIGYDLVSAPKLLLLIHVIIAACKDLQLFVLFAK